MVSTQHADHAFVSLSLPRRRTRKVRDLNACSAWPAPNPSFGNHGEACRLCGQPLLIPIPGRDVCEMCRVDRGDS